MILAARIHHIYSLFGHHIKAYLQNYSIIGSLVDNLMRLQAWPESSVFLKRRKMAKKPPTLPSVPATLSDLSIRLYYKAVILASFPAMSASYSKS